MGYRAMDPKPPDGLADKVGAIRKHLDKVLIAASGLTLLVGGYFTYDYKAYVDCQVQLLEADRQFTTKFTNAMVVLLTQPPRPPEERLAAFVEVRTALQEKVRVQEQLGTCQ